MNGTRGKEFWVYWGIASMAAAAVGGFVLPWLLDKDPLHLGEVLP